MTGPKPEWLTDLKQDLETRSARAGCTHERDAYSIAALMVEQYWEDAQDD